MALQVTPSGGEPRALTTEEQAEVRDGIGAGTYSLPDGGIPAGSLTAAAQASLAAADTAVQPAALADVQQAADAAQASADAAQAGAAAAQADADSAGSAVTAHAARTDNPHAVTKIHVGLGNVDNTADASKPVSTAQATAINAKYTRPGTGIPASDLAAAVQTSLGKADTASQPAAVTTEISSAVAAHAAAADPHPTYLTQAEGDGRYASAAQGVLAGTALQDLADMQAAFDAGSTEAKQAFQSSVSGGWIKPDVANFAALLAVPSPEVGDMRRTIAGPFDGGTPYLQWVYTGAGWRLACLQTLLEDTSATAGVAQAAEQILRSILIPAGMLLSIRRMRIAWTMTRGGTTDALTTRLRIGASGTVTDTLLSLDAGLTTLRTRGIEHVGGAISQTVWRYAHNSIAGWGVGANTGTVAPNDTTVANMASAITLSVTASMAGATDAPTLSALSIQAV